MVKKNKIVWFAKIWEPPRQHFGFFEDWRNFGNQQKIGKFLGFAVILRYLLTDLLLSRPPSVRVDHGLSILVVCYAGASATMTVKTDVWMTVLVASIACVCWLLDTADAKLSAYPPLCGGLCQLVFSCFEVLGHGSSPLWPIYYLSKQNWL